MPFTLATAPPSASCSWLTNEAGSRPRSCDSSAADESVTSRRSRSSALRIRRPIASWRIQAASAAARAASERSSVVGTAVPVVPLHGLAATGEPLRRLQNQYSTEERLSCRAAGRTLARTNTLDGARRGGVYCAYPEALMAHTATAPPRIPHG